MNYRTFTLSHLSLFFCLCGWVCAGSAIGAQTADDGQVAAAPGTTITVGGEENAEAESLFAADVDDDSADLPAGQTVEVGEAGQIELHVENQEVTKILKLLSLQAHRNIVASRNVAGTVSADLYGVDFYEALDAVLHANGFGYREKANFIYVYTSEEMAKMAELEAKLVTHIVRLNYITADYAKTFADPLLSERGSIIVNTELASSMEPTLEDNGKNEFAYPDTLVIRDQQEHVDEIIRIIDDLDKRPKQVLIEATILRVQLDEDNAFGTDLSVVLDNNISVFDDPLAIVDEVITGDVGYVDNAFQTIHTLVGGEGGETTARGGLKIGVTTKNVSVFVRALDSVSDTTVIAKPKLLVLNRHRAKLMVVEKLGYITSTTSETSTTQTVEFLESGTQLTVRPFASDDGFIRLEIQPVLSAGTRTPIGGVIVPDETANELLTNVMVRSGQTVVLGGLFKEDTTVSKNQVPGLGQMPVVGAAFKGQDDVISRSEVIFLITPTVIKDQSLYAGGDEADRSATDVGIGAKTGLLPWSRSKQTAAHMRNAMKYHRQGDTDKALLYVKMALALEPTFPDALKLKRELVKQARYEPQRSILEQSVDAIVAEQQEANEAAEQQSAKPIVAPQAPATAEPTTPVAAETSSAPAETQADTPEPQPEPTAKADPEPAAEPESEATAKAAPESDAPAEAPDVAIVEPEDDLKAEVQPPVDPEKLSAKLLESMSRWLPGGAPTARTAAVDEAAGDN